VRVLLDTHAFLWLADNPERLAPAALEALRDPRTDVFVSAVSAWEIAIKVAIGKLRIPLPPTQWVAERMARSRLTGLSIEIRHAVRIAALPRHHRDPFDRMLAAQAEVEGLRLATRDRSFAAYGIDLLPL
jgi:PIN domain nuclease of toxin-antitoxin system